LALFWPRGATGCRCRRPGLSRPGLVRRCGRGPAASPTAADLRSRGTLEPAERVAQPRQLVVEPLVSRDLSLDLLDPRLDLLDDRAHVGNFGHLSPVLGAGRHRNGLPFK
jgi:hypothetical protein